MTNSPTPKGAAKAPSQKLRKIAPKVAAETVGEKHRKMAAKVAAEKAREKLRKIAPKVAAESVGSAKTAPKVAAGWTKEKHRKTARKAAAESADEKHRETVPKVAAGTLDEKSRETATPSAPAEATDSLPAFAETSVTPQFERLHPPQVPNSMRAAAERGVVQTRELYERSANALRALLETWERSLDAAGQGAVALNRKIFDIAEHNIGAGFDLMTSLAGAKSLVEVMEVQAAHWRKQFLELKMQTEEVRALSTKVIADVAEPIKAQMTRNIVGSTRRIKSAQELKN